MGSFRQFSISTRSWHKTLLTGKELNFLKKVPTLIKVHADNNAFFLAHASPQGDISKYLDSDDDIANDINSITSEYILLGHTHIQFMKKIKNSIVINPGSVGLSRDGGQASYAVYKDGQIKLKRIKYNVEKTINSLMESPIPIECKKGLRKILLNY
jgi:predicted phosphodiesterase